MPPAGRGPWQRAAAARWHWPWLTEELRWLPPWPTARLRLGVASGGVVGEGGEGGWWGTSGHGARGRVPGRWREEGRWAGAAEAPKQGRCAAGRGWRRPARAAEEGMVGHEARARGRVPGQWREGGRQAGAGAAPECRDAAGGPPSTGDWGSRRRGRMDGDGCGRRDEWVEGIRREGYIGHFTFFSNLNHQEKLFCQTFL
jgi:hypothetical protein